MKVVSLFSSLALLASLTSAVPSRLDIDSTKTVLTLNKRIKRHPLPHAPVQVSKLLDTDLVDDTLDKALEKRCDTCGGGGGGGGRGGDGSDTDVDVGVGVSSDGDGNTDIDVNVRVRSGRPPRTFVPDGSSSFPLPFVLLRLTSPPLDDDSRLRSRLRYRQSRLRCA
jgi:hypothetical protein